MFVDHTDYAIYDWEDWCMLPVLTNELVIQHVSGAIRAPRIIRLAVYDKIPVRAVKLSRKNIWIRDQGRCQYTGRKMSFDEMTLDHVKPQSQGGEDSWTNLVACSKEINTKKANKTPREAGLKLLNEPKVPSWTPLFTATMSEPDPSWIPFLPHLKKSNEQDGKKA
ncbi:MAG: HNH endonuclease [Candidatus Competibacteraceae bacterium]|nr:HNH endonuclease [Candidatus Competibacteraceae bacterium]